MGLQITIPATQEPVTLEDLTSQVRVVDPRDYAKLTAMAVAAREWCEAYLGQQFCTATYLWTVDRFTNLYLYQTAIWSQNIWPWQYQSQTLLANRLATTWWTLWPPRSPVQSITQIQYVDLNGATQTLGPANYQFSTDLTQNQARLAPSYGNYWPVTRQQFDGVKVTMVCGYPKVPAAIRLAILEIAAAWFDQREAVSYDDPKNIPFGALSKLDSFATGRYLGGV